MDFLGGIFLFLFILPFTISQSFDWNSFPRPLIIEINEAQSNACPYEEVQLKCTSWRVSVEANNVSPWLTVPVDCAEYVKEYLEGRGYELDLQTTSNEAAIYARSVNLTGDGKDIWIFDIDETLLSNLPFYAEYNYFLENFNESKFDEWVEIAAAPAVESSLKLYEEVLSLGFKVFLLTGRIETQRIKTAENLISVGFRGWEKLILRSSEDYGKTATKYKSERRNELVEAGYRILGNSGDQWSDLLGYSMSSRSFKLPNPLYFIP